MSGHSKWSTIKRKKEKLDSKRSAVFTKILRELTVAVKEGGPDPEGNARLRMAINNAKKANLPKDNMERAIKKGSSSEAANMIETTYEGYAPNKVAILVECATDNINRTVANIRAIFSRRGGNMGVSGSVNYLFERKGVFVINAEGLDEDEFTLDMLEYGAEDVELEDGVYTVTVPFTEFGTLNSRLEEQNIETEESGLQQIPTTTVSLSWEEARKSLNLVDALEEDEDVMKVFHNLEMTDEIMEGMNNE